MTPLELTTKSSSSDATSFRGINRTDVKSAARDLEAAFLAEMLAHAGFEKALTNGGGFVGEGMAGFLVAEISRRLAMQEIFGVAKLIEPKLGDGK